MIRYLIAVLVFPLQAFAASDAELDRLHVALDTAALIEILSEEGVMQSEELRETMFPGRGGIGWAASIDRIYETEALYATFRDAFDDVAGAADITPLLEFYSGETGEAVARLEVDARRAIMSEEVEEAARLAFRALRADPTPRLEMLEEFAEINDLIDGNVTGALNSNLAFYRGLATGGGFEMSEDQMLAEVWGQEAEIRDDTTEWVFGYMTLAYDGLSDAQMTEYIDLASSEAGRVLNRALFAGFEAVFEGVAFQLGAVTAQFSTGDEL